MKKRNEFNQQERGEQRNEQKLSGGNFVKKDDLNKYQDQSQKPEYKQSPRDEQRKEQKLNPKADYSQKQDSTFEKNEKNRKY